MKPQSDEANTGLIVTVWVQPGASRERVVGLLGDAVKIAVTVPPEKGKANRAVEQLIAKELRISPASVKVISGGGARRKHVRITGVRNEQITAWLAKL